MRVEEIIVHPSTIRYFSKGKINILPCDLSSSKYNIFYFRAGVEVDSPSFILFSLLGLSLDFFFWPLAMTGVDTTNTSDCFFGLANFRAIKESERVEDVIGDRSVFVRV